MVLSEQPLKEFLHVETADGLVFLADDKPFAQLDFFDSVFTLSWLSTGEFPDYYVLADILSILLNQRPRTGFIRAAAPSSLQIRIAKIDGKQREYSSRELESDRLSPGDIGMLLEEPTQLSYRGTLLSLDMSAHRGRSPEPWFAFWVDTYQRSDYPEVGITLEYDLREFWGVNSLFRISVGTKLDDKTQGQFFTRVNEALRR
jgi:hypothetical protein